MPALNFSPQFVAAVENGLDKLACVPLRHAGIKPKLQTIRAYRKRGDPKAGDTLYLFTAMRTKACRRLGTVTCRDARAVSISRVGTLRIEGKLLDPEDACALARRDGFADTNAMRDWFDATHGLPFEGMLIRWGS